MLFPARAGGVRWAEEEIVEVFGGCPGDFGNVQTLDGRRRHVRPPTPAGWSCRDAASAPGRGCRSRSGSAPAAPSGPLRAVPRRCGRSGCPKTRCRSPGPAPHRPPRWVSVKQWNTPPTRPALRRAAAPGCRRWRCGCAPPGQPGARARRGCDRKALALPGHVGHAAAVQAVVVEPGFAHAHHRGSRPRGPAGRPPWARARLLSGCTPTVHQRLSCAVRQCRARPRTPPAWCRCTRRGRRRRRPCRAGCRPARSVQFGKAQVAVRIDEHAGPGGGRRRCERAGLRSSAWAWPTRWRCPASLRCAASARASSRRSGSARHALGAATRGIGRRDPGHLAGHRKALRVFGQRQQQVDVFAQRYSRVVGTNRPPSVSSGM
jgi:hypothetical protein